MKKWCRERYSAIPAGLGNSQILNRHVPQFAHRPPYISLVNNFETEFLQAYESSPFPAYKHSTYLDAYPNLLSPYIGKEVTLVEVGLFKGGSLFMWRNFLGDKVRIIGVDIEQSSVQWRDFGFEIHIGDQSDPAFWKTFFHNVGPVDILIDDGGHGNLQQISTVVNAVNFINDGGLLIIEDTHCSYRRDFGNPHPYSFTKFSFRVAGWVNKRFFGKTDLQKISAIVNSVQYFQSMVVFHVDRSKSKFSTPTSNLAARTQEAQLSESPRAGLAQKIKGTLTANLIIIPKEFLKNFRARRFFKG